MATKRERGNTNVNPNIKIQNFFVLRKKSVSERHIEEDLNG
jgi:hypothetical protein